MERTLSSLHWRLFRLSHITYIRHLNMLPFLLAHGGSSWSFQGIYHDMICDISYHSSHFISHSFWKESLHTLKCCEWTLLGILIHHAKVSGHDPVERQCFTDLARGQLSWDDFLNDEWPMISSDSWRFEVNFSRTNTDHWSQFVCVFVCACFHVQAKWLKCDTMELSEVPLEGRPFSLEAASVQWRQMWRSLISSRRTCSVDRRAMGNSELTHGHFNLNPCTMTAIS